MDDQQKISSTRIKRLTYNAANSPCGLWTWPDPVDGPSSAPCYAPYGEQSPPIANHQATEQEAIEPTIEAEARQSEGLKPWEKGSKTGKKIKKGRGPKGHSYNHDEESSVGSNDMINSSNNNNNNTNTVGSNGISTTSASTLSSSQPSPVEPLVLDPMLAAHDTAARRPRIRLLPPSAPYVPPPHTAQAALAESRKRNIDRIDNEVPLPSRKKSGSE